MMFQTKTLDQICPTIAYSFKIKQRQDSHIVDILIVSFEGSYRNGSMGTPDAGLIKGIVGTGIAVFRPHKLLVDLSKLEYNWGDDMDLVLGSGDEASTIFLVGSKCRRAISTLTFGINTKQDIVDHKLFFDNFQEALDFLSQTKV